MNIVCQKPKFKANSGRGTRNNQKNVQMLIKPIKLPGLEHLTRVDVSACGGTEHLALTADAD